MELRGSLAYYRMIAVNVGSTPAPLVCFSFIERSVYHAMRLKTEKQN